MQDNERRHIHQSVSHRPILQFGISPCDRWLVKWAQLSPPYATMTLQVFTSGDGGVYVPSLESGMATWLA